jgi:hypothetical protein
MAWASLTPVQQRCAAVLQQRPLSQSRYSPCCCGQLAIRHCRGVGAWLSTAAQTKGCSCPGSDQPKHHKQPPTCRSCQGPTAFMTSHGRLLLLLLAPRRDQPATLAAAAVRLASAAGQHRRQRHRPTLLCQATTSGSHQVRQAFLVSLWLMHAGSHVLAAM